MSHKMKSIRKSTKKKSATRYTRKRYTPRYSTYRRKYAARRRPVYRKKVPSIRRRKSTKKSSSFHPTFVVSDTGSAKPIVPLNHVVLGLTGRKGTVYFKKLYCSNVQFCVTSTDISLTLVKSKLVRDAITSYGRYYGLDARVIVFYPPYPGKIIGASSQSVSVVVTEFNLFVAQYMGALKRRSLGLDNLNFDMIRSYGADAAAAAGATSFASVPIAPPGNPMQTPVQ